MAHEILIVDDEPDIRLLIDGLLRDEGYETRQAGDSDAAIAAFRARRPSLILLDIWLQGSKLDGLGILKTLHREEPAVPAIMISGHGTIETAVAAIQHGAYDFIEKPFQSDRLLLVIRRALEAARLAAENAELRLRAGQENVGDRHQPGDQCREGSDRAGGADRVARADHRGCRQRQGSGGADDSCPLPPCRGALCSAQLRDTEPGAFRRGAFLVSRPGMIRRRHRVVRACWSGAHGGTLLLDEGVGHAAGDAGQDRACATGPDV